MGGGGGGGSRLGADPEARRQLRRPRRRLLRPPLPARTAVAGIAGVVMLCCGRRPALRSDAMNVTGGRGGAHAPKGARLRRARVGAGNESGRDRARHRVGAAAALQRRFRRLRRGWAPPSPVRAQVRGLRSKKIHRPRSHPPASEPLQPPQPSAHRAERPSRLPCAVQGRRTGACSPGSDSVSERGPNGRGAERFSPGVLPADRRLLAGLGRHRQRLRHDN